jgi:5'-methylthioadenosine phosphorylase
MAEKIGIIAGSRAYDLRQEMAQAGWEVGALQAVGTPFGPSSPMGQARVRGQEAVLVSRHGAEGYSIAAPFVNYRANVYALKDQGVTRIIAWSGPGAIDDTLQIGQLVIPADIIDETRRRESTFYEGTGLGFIRSHPVFCPQVAAAARVAIGGELGRDAREDLVYVCTEGPRLETAAEVRRYRLFGAHLVGMTLAPEAFLARELEMCYAAICYVTNYAEGVRETPYRPGELFEGMVTPAEKQAAEAAVRRLPAVVAATVERLTQAPRTCHCHETMRRYKLRGDIGEDWREWIKRPS